VIIDYLSSDETKPTPKGRPEPRRAKTKMQAKLDLIDVSTALQGPKMPHKIVINFAEVKVRRRASIMAGSPEFPDFSERISQVILQ